MDSDDSNNTQFFHTVAHKWAINIFMRMFCIDYLTIPFTGWYKTLVSYRRWRPTKFLFHGCTSRTRIYILLASDYPINEQFENNNWWFFLGSIVELCASEFVLACIHYINTALAHTHKLTHTHGPTQTLMLSVPTWFGLGKNQPLRNHLQRSAILARRYVIACRDT